MPIIIQETEVQVTPASSSQPDRGTSAADYDTPSPVVPLRPVDVERLVRYLNARRARLYAD